MMGRVMMMTRPLKRAGRTAATRVKMDVDTSTFALVSAVGCAVSGRLADICLDGCQAGTGFQRLVKQVSISLCWHGCVWQGYEWRTNSCQLRCMFSAFPGVMEEKVSATNVLGQYAEACPTAFMPYMEPTLKTLSTMVEYWHDDARAAAYDSLHKLVLAAHSCFPPSQHAASNGNPSIAEPVDLSPQTQHVLGAVLPLLISSSEHDTSKIAVAAAAGALGQLLKQLGRGAVVADHLAATSKMAQELLHGTAICQVGTCYCRALVDITASAQQGTLLLILDAVPPDVLYPALAGSCAVQNVLHPSAGCAHLQIG